MTLIYSLLTGGDCIDDADVLRSGATAAVLGHAVRAPSTLGTFLRSRSSWADARQLDRVSRVALARAWDAGAGPGDSPLTIDLDSSICETYGLKKEGGRFGHTKVRCYHPLLALRALTGEVLHSRLCGGNAHTGRGAASFLTECMARVREAGATGKITVRADSGFYSQKDRESVRAGRRRLLDHHQDVTWPAQTDREIPEQDWVPSRTSLTAPRSPRPPTLPFPRVGRRARTLGSACAASAPPLARSCRCSPPSPTTPSSPTAPVTCSRWRPIIVATRVRERHPRPQVQGGAQSRALGRFGANAAWLALNGIAHNLSRWVGMIGFGEQSFACTKTLRRRYFSLAGRITRSARRRVLHLSRDWPWAAQFLGPFALLRSVRLVV